MGPPPRSFAADAHECIMVRVLDPPDDNFKSNPAVPDLIARNDYWELDVDYWPVGQSYSWALWPYASTQTMARTGRDRRDGMVLGDDTPARIADRVCTVVTGQGANVR